jgi:hypothetical protein
MGGDYMRPKGMSKEQLFKARTEDFEFRNPMGNSFTMRGRTPDLPSAPPKRPANLDGTRPGGRIRTYEKMLGMEKSITGKSPL